MRRKYSGDKPRLTTYRAPCSSRGHWWRSLQVGACRLCRRQIFRSEAWYSSATSWKSVVVAEIRDVLQNGGESGRLIGIG